LVWDIFVIVESQCGEVCVFVIRMSQQTYYNVHYFLMKSTMLLLLLTTLVTLTIADNYCGQHNCYELLGVDRTADEQTIKKAFREMAKKYHPDKNRQEDTTEIFQYY